MTLEYFLLWDISYIHVYFGGLKFCCSRAHQLWLMTADLADSFFTLVQKEPLFAQNLFETWFFPRIVMTLYGYGYFWGDDGAPLLLVSFKGFRWMLNRVTGWRTHNRKTGWRQRLHSMVIKLDSSGNLYREELRQTFISNVPLQQ